MKRIRYLFMVLGMLLSSVTYAAVQVSIGIGLPHVSIGINIPVYPELVVVPGYPVYYAPRLQANLFFYDGLYWIYQDDYWYASSWYNGPWWVVEPEVVPVFILRVPVRYYRHPPAYFMGWRNDAPPRWGDHWGHDWNQHRSGWDRWDRRSAPPPAPQPVYQRQYSGDRYPQQVEQQQELHQQNYRYQPRDPVVQQRYQEQAAPRSPAQQEKQRMPEQNGNKPQDIQRPVPGRQDTGAVAPNSPNTPNSGAPQKRGEDAQRPTQSTPQQGRPEQDQRQQPAVEPRKQQGTSTPERQNTSGGNDNPAATRTQPPQQGGVNVQRPEQTSTQKGQPQERDRGQQPRQDTEQRGKNTTNEPKNRSDQDGNGGRNNY